MVKRLLGSETRLDFATSVTTRPPRAQEVDGREYLFISEQRFEEMIANDELLEWANVFGHLYGTPRSAIALAEQRGADILLDIDVQGAASLKEKLPKAVSVFILPPSRNALEQRLRMRSSDEDRVIERRLGEASREVGQYKAYDHVVVNRDVDRSVEALRTILLAERSKRGNMEDQIEPILMGFGIHDSEVSA